MLPAKFARREKEQIVWGMNKNIAQGFMGYTASIGSKASTTAVHYIFFENKLGNKYKKKFAQCNTSYSAFNPGVINVKCEIPAEKKSINNKLGLIDIKDIIKELTASEDGRNLWKEAQDKVNAELWDEVVNGRMTRVKYFRIINNLTQKELAEKAHIKQPDVSRIEKAGYRGSIATYKKLADILNVNYKELMP